MALPPATAALLAPPALPERDVQSLRPAHSVGFNIATAGPPSNLYVTVNDLLQVMLMGISAAPVLVDVRILTADGQIVIQEETISAPANRTRNFFTFRLPEGFILSVSVGPQSVALPRGTLYAQIALVRSQAPAVQYTYILAQGYIGLLAPIYWPNSRSDFSTYEQGLPTSLNQAAPGAGLDWSFTPVVQLRSLLQSMQCTLTTSAAAGTRQVVIQISQAGNIIFTAPAPSSQAPSLAVTYNFTPGVTSIPTAGGVCVTEMPNEVTINSNFTISTVTGGLLAGDQWGIIKVGTMDWLDQ